MIELQVDEVAPGRAVLHAAGRLNMVAAASFRTLVSELVAQGRTTVVVDLAATTFMDSSGLGALIAGLKSTRQAGGDLRIACAGDQVQMVLELTQMHTVLRPHASVEDALDAN